jgi:hypothetical protein
MSLTYEDLDAVVLHVAEPRKLFRQVDLPFNSKLAAHDGSTCARLASADAYRVVSCSDDRLAILGHQPQVAIFEFKMDPLAPSRIEMNALKSSKRDMRRTRYSWEFKIKLDDLVSC